MTGVSCVAFKGVKDSAAFQARRCAIIWYYLPLRPCSSGARKCSILLMLLRAQPRFPARRAMAE